MRDKAESNKRFDLPQAEPVKQSFDSISVNTSPADLGELMEAYRHYLLAHAKRGWHDNERRKMGDSDLVQLTLIKGMERFEEFRGSTSAELAAWLRAILQRQMITERRRMSAQKADAGREVSLEELQVVDKVESSRQTILKQEMKQQIRDAVDALPPHYREVVKLYQFKGLPFEVIGQRLEKSPEAVRKIWARAIVKLGFQLKSQLDSGGLGSKV